MTGRGDIDGQCADLTAWLPALADALARDTVTVPGSRILSSGTVVNPDVLHALATLSTEIPQACTTAAGLCREPWHPRPLPTCLRALPRFHQRLTTLDHQAAKHLAYAVGHWTRITKLALGLQRPDTPVGYDCPWCDPPSPLVMLGDEGTLTAGMTVLWQHSGVIACRQWEDPVGVVHGCGATWQAGEWLHLGRLLATA